MKVPEHFEELRALENTRVKMRFTDEHQVIARLVSATTDRDGSRHLLYDRVAWSSDPDSYQASENTTFYAGGETLFEIEPALEERG